MPRTVSESLNMIESAANRASVRVEARAREVVYENPGDIVGISWLYDLAHELDCISGYAERDLGDYEAGGELEGLVLAPLISKVRGAECDETRLADALEDAMCSYMIELEDKLAESRWEFHHEAGERDEAYIDLS